MIARPRPARSDSGSDRPTKPFKPPALARLPRYGPPGSRVHCQFQWRPGRAAKVESPGPGRTPARPGPAAAPRD
eukprot:748171-Hanusia_phi.AAC.1